MLLHCAYFSELLYKPEKARKHNSVASLLLMTWCFIAVLMFIWLCFHQSSNLNNQTINSRFPGDRALPHSHINTNALWKTELKVHSNGQWPVPQSGEHTTTLCVVQLKEWAGQTEFHLTLESHFVVTLAFSLLFKLSWKTWWGMQSADHLQKSVSTKQTSTIQCQIMAKGQFWPPSIYPSIHPWVTHLLKIKRD